MVKPHASNMTIKRIHREIADLQKEDMGEMTLEPNEDNLFEWKGAIPGPEGSPYEGGLFNISVELAPDYPFSAPKITFQTRIYHMNISDRGGVCIDLLKHNWSPALSLYKVLLSLSSLLTDPNPSDPLVPSIANTYKRNRKEHDDYAREWTRLYALPPKQPKSVKGKAKASDAKGKGKAIPSSSAIRDSEEPGNHGRAATRSSGRLRNKRTGHVEANGEQPTNEVISLLSDSEDSDKTSTANTRGTVDLIDLTKSRPKRRQDVDEDDSQGRSKARRLNATRDVDSLDDVIVIED